MNKYVKTILGGVVMPKGIINSFERKVTEMYSSSIREGLKVCGEIEEMCISMAACGYNEIAVTYQDKCREYKDYLEKVSQTPIDILVEKMSKGK